MTELKTPTAVLHEGPRSLSENEIADIERRDLKEIRQVDIDDVIEHVHHGLRKLPDFVTLYRKYLKQRWDVYELDFTQDRIDWTEKMTGEERESFVGIASGFHHGERQVEIELPVFMIGATEEEKLHIAAQIEDEARHTVFFDRFYREVVGIEGADIMEVLDKSFPWVQETFVGPFGLLAYQADELRRNPYDQRARVRYGTTYFLWIEGVLALSVMKVTLSYARWRGFLPAYYTGFTATCRDESRHVQGGMRYLQDAVRHDPTMLGEIHATLHTILTISGVSSRKLYYEPLGWTEDEVRVLLIQQLRRKCNDVGISLSQELEDLLEQIEPVLAGRLIMSMFFSQEWADGVKEALNAGPSEESLAGKLQEYWDFYNLIRYTYPSSWALGARDLPAEMGGGTRYLVVTWSEGFVNECRVVDESEQVEATYVLAADYHDWKALFEGYDALRTVMYRKLLLEDGDLLEFFKAIYFFVECLALIATVPTTFPVNSGVPVAV